MYIYWRYTEEGLQLQLQKITSLDHQKYIGSTEIVSFLYKFREHGWHAERNDLVTYRHLVTIPSPGNHTIT